MNLLVYLSHARASPGALTGSPILHKELVKLMFYPHLVSENPEADHSHNTRTQWPFCLVPKLLSFSTRPRGTSVA